MLDEVQFIFERIWKATKNINGYEVYDQMENVNQVRIQDYFHVIDICGKLLNKAEPSDDDDRPGQLFNQFSKLTIMNKQK